MNDPKYEERFNNESIATVRQWAQRNQIQWAYPGSWAAGGTRLHRSFDGGHVRHVRYPDILFPVETVNPT